MHVFEQLKEADRIRGEKRAEAIAFFGESRTTHPPRIKPVVGRPVCPNCGRTFGNRHTKHEHKHYAIGEPIEPYQGNHHLVRQEIAVGAQMGPENGPGAMLTRETWDGVSYYSGADPFCTNTCAIGFGIAAYRAGFRRVTRDD